MKGIALLDWDGTTFLETTPIPYTADLLQLLFRHDFKAIFLTNNSSRRTSDFRAILERNDLWSERTEIITSTLATIWYLKKELQCDKAFILGNDAMKSEFAASGIQHCEEGPGVVVGFDTSLTYGSLQTAHKLLLRGGFFIATHPDPTCPTSAESLIDCGSFLAALEISSRRTPTIVGKPRQPICDFLHLNYLEQGLDCIVMGDREETDGLLAERLGARYIRTYDREMLELEVARQVLDTVESAIICP